MQEIWASQLRVVDSREWLKYIANAVEVSSIVLFPLGDAFMGMLPSPNTMGSRKYYLHESM